MFQLYLSLTLKGSWEIILLGFVWAASNRVVKPVSGHNNQLLNPNCLAALATPRPRITRLCHLWTVLGNPHPVSLPRQINAGRAPGWCKVSSTQSACKAARTRAGSPSPGWLLGGRWKDISEMEVEVRERGSQGSRQEGRTSIYWAHTVGRQWACHLLQLIYLTPESRGRISSTPYRCRDWGSESSSNLPRVTKRVKVSLWFVHPQDPGHWGQWEGPALHCRSTSFRFTLSITPSSPTIPQPPHCHPRRGQTGTVVQFFWIFVLVSIKCCTWAGPVL